MSKRFEIGRLSEVLGRPLALALLLAQFGLAVVFAAGYHAGQSSDGCLYCHADKDRMRKAGYPQFFITQAQVEKESRMPGVKCRDCHLGDGRSRDKDAAHKGMLKLIVLDGDLNAVPRKGLIDKLIPTGDNRMYAMLPKIDDGGGRLDPDPDVFTVLWHDRDPVTLGYDPKIAEETCGKSGCHPQEVEQFSKSDMGGNVRQRSMRFWTDTHGPNNCGPSFADLPPAGGAGFSDKNYTLVKGQTSCPSSYKDATDRQRYCNVCHAGCLDCHYDPMAKKGTHAFTRNIPATSCAGGGRGTGMCHAGTQERRRGDSYLGAEFSQPAGLPTDVHVQKKMECVDCHMTGEKGMGDIQRRVDCSGCHYSAVKALEGSVHKRLRCQACHVSELGGYAMTVWGRGHISGRENPFKKYSLYYGVTESPILIKDRKGFYTPYKIFPNIATNISQDMKKHDGIDFRWRGGETRDAYAFLGTYPNPGADRALAWLQIEAVGHPLGKSRSCASCHSSTAQRARADWEYMGFTGADAFTGEHTLIADENGLRMEGFGNTSPINLIGDARMCDFAAWKGIGDIWRIGGDFSIPKADSRKYSEYTGADREFAIKMKALESRAAGDDLKRKLKKIKETGVHDPEMGLAEMKKEGF